MNFRWQDDVQFAYDQDPRFIQPAYGIADFKLGATFSAGRYDVSVVVKNAFDQQYVSNVIAQVLRAEAPLPTPSRGTSADTLEMSCR